MRLYTSEQEHNIETQELVREWARSGLLDRAQADRLGSDLRVDLRRTNLFLRIVLFAFGLLVVAACVGLTMELLNPGSRRGPLAVLFFLSAGICFVLSSRLASCMYRFGIEESLAVSAVVLTGFGAGAISANELVGGLLAASAAALLVYLRFGYVYAAVGSMACLAASAFQVGQSETMERVIVVLMLLPIFIFVRHETIAAVAWIGVYAAIHVAGGAFPPLFYWSTYGLIWLLPAIGLYLALKNKNRVLLDVNLVMALVTLATNKPYLGLERRAWDPILLGMFLIVTALVARRWLANGAGAQQHGFTASRILNSDKQALAFVGTVSAAVQPQVPANSPSAPEFKPGGGRSGGAGASGTF